MQQQSNYGSFENQAINSRCNTQRLDYSKDRFLLIEVDHLRQVASRAGPSTAFGRVVGRQAYTKICAEQLCNICCEYHYIIYTHLRDNYVVYHHRTKMAEAATSHACRAISHQPLIG